MDYALPKTILDGKLGREAEGMLQVLLYLNATGLMWENAEHFGALLIFAEHRYYGESLPFGQDSRKYMQWLSAEQALADYAVSIHDYKAENSLESSPVIGFGGSYGGMLATWARLKYPHVRHALHCLMPARQARPSPAAIACMRNCQQSCACVALCGGLMLLASSTADATRITLSAL
jgi:pimeloyl-ACP methyl ester carboxylesterase